MGGAGGLINVPQEKNDMAVSVLAEAKQYLYRHGTMTDTTIDPVDLVRDLVRENEQLDKQLRHHKKKSQK